MSPYFAWRVQVFLLSGAGFLAIALACFSIGSAEESALPVEFEDVEAEPEEEDGFNLDLARAALVKLAESSDEPAFKVSIEFLKSAPFKMQKNGWATMGNWRVHIKRRLFGLDVIRPPLLELWEGEFKQNKNGEWIASVTGVTRT